MRQFALKYDETSLTEQAISQLPWGHIILLLQKVKDDNERNWYAEKSIENGWSRSSLLTHIERNLYKKQGISDNKISNYRQILPPPQSDLAHEILKDPYDFQFLTIDQKAREKEIEKKLIHHMKDFLIELGKGFSFVGSQYAISVGEKDLYIDLLMYHLKLRCFVVLEILCGAPHNNSYVVPAVMCC
jgi:predicted nuclease of restriction endonuclease-like (RecB) superfamily